ncbi:hypothetical protein OAV66_00395 [Planktomarina temperata]|nr:hypothetical protein [Planktomarina temperata]
MKDNKKVVLGLNIMHPDSSACLYVGDKLIGAVAQERLGNRVKHDLSFPADCIKFLLASANIKVRDIDIVAIARDPRSNRIKKLQSLMRSKRSITQAVSSYLMRLNKSNTFVSDLATVIGNNNDENCYKIINVEHHIAHISASFFTSPFNTAAGFSFDGSGDGVSVMYANCSANAIDVVERQFLPASLGHFYTAMCQLIGFEGFGEEYKVMGLAPYGDACYIEQMSKIIWVDKSGILCLEPKYFRVGKAYDDMRISDTGELVMGNLYTDELRKLLGVTTRLDSKNISQQAMNIAKSTQVTFENIALTLINKLSEKLDNQNLCLGGGCALNGVLNAKILEKTKFKYTHHHPAASDDGNSIGAALYARHVILKQDREASFFSPYTGPEFSSAEIKRAIEAVNLKYHILSNEDELIQSAAKQIADGDVIAWYQGRSEWGPRALGNRSILANPRHPKMKDIINTKIKKRESFRPFAPSVLDSEVEHLFETKINSPYMMHVVPFKTRFRKLFPSVSHVDGTGRIQTVSKELNELYYLLIEKVKEYTGHGIVLNTSFNENEPVVTTPEEALSCFMRTDIDSIYLGNIVVHK